MARLEKLILVLDRSRKRLALAVGVAVLLHLPFTPVMPVLRLLNRVTRQKDNSPNPQPTAPRQVEVELQDALRNEELRHEQAQVQKPTNGPSLSVDAPSSVKFNKSAPNAKTEEEKASLKPKEPKKEKVKNIGLEGNLENKITGKPGVTLGLWFSSMRDHPLGKRLTEIATCDAEWRSFVGQGVNLMQDFEGVLVVGPNLTDSGQMTAAVRHNLPSERVHDVMDKLVQKSGKNGRWLQPDVATARLGRVQRVLIPKQGDLFFVAPSKGWQALSNVKEPLQVPASEGRALSLVVVQPNRLFERVGLTLPRRLHELRLEIFANPDKSIDIKVELEDSSAAAAKQDARSVSTQLHDFFADIWVTTAALRAITGNDSKASPEEVPSLETAPRLDLSPDDKTLEGMVHLSPEQARTTLELISSVICRKPRKSPVPAK